MTTTIFHQLAPRGALAAHITLSDRDHERLLLFVEQRGHELERLDHELARARVVPAAEIPPDVVTIGSRVAYEDTRAGARRVVTVVLPADADAARGCVSVLAPIGSALIGLRVGDEIEWELPNRRQTRLRVVALEHQERA